MSYKKVLCYGTINPDLMYFIDGIPEIGGDIRSKDYKIIAGGTAINCAENIINWGIETSVMGNSIGKDPLGDFLLSYLDKLLLFSKGDLPSYNDLKNEFDYSSNIFLKNYLVQRSENSIFTKFFLKFFNLKPDDKNLIEDNTIKRLSIAKSYLYQKDIDNSLAELRKINYNLDHFERWIEQASRFNESIRIINFLENNLDNI